MVREAFQIRTSTAHAVFMAHSSRPTQHRQQNMEQERSKKQDISTNFYVIDNADLHERAIDSHKANQDRTDPRTWRLQVGRDSRYMYNKVRALQVVDITSFHPPAAPFCDRDSASRLVFRYFDLAGAASDSLSASLSLLSFRYNLLQGPDDPYAILLKLFRLFAFPLCAFGPGSWSSYKTSFDSSRDGSLIVAVGFASSNNALAWMGTANIKLRECD